MKRTLQDEDFSPEKRNKAGKLDTRWIIKGNQVGGVIGKNGATVKTIREQSSACVSVLNRKSADKQSDQLMLVRGTAEEVAEGLKLIAIALLEAQASRRDGESVELASSINLTMLVPSVQVGAIIGKQGATIQAINKDSGAVLQIAKEAYAGSTDKSVDISGSPESICAATLKVLLELEAHPIKEGTSQTNYRPGQMAPAGPAGGMQQMGQMGGVLGGMAGNPYNFTAADYGGMAGMAAQMPGFTQQIPVSRVVRSGGSSGGSGDNMKEGHIEQKISIPTVCAGTVIGKRGATIQALSKQSGCNIIIAPPETEAVYERIVTLKGNPEAIEKAIALIRQVIEQFQYTNPQSFV